MEGEDSAQWIPLPLLLLMILLFMVGDETQQKIPE